MNSRTKIVVLSLISVIACAQSSHAEPKVLGTGQSGVCHWGAADYTWVADFNGDGKSDIASANGGNVYLYLSSGLDFVLQAWTVPNAWGAAGYTWVADFNGDGKADIASANSGDVYMHLSTGSGFNNTTWTVPNA